MHVKNGDHGRPVFLWFFVDCMFLKLFLALTTSMKCPKINETLRLMLGRLMQACTTAAGVMVTLRHGSLKCANWTFFAFFIDKTVKHNRYTYILVKTLRIDIFFSEWSLMGHRKTSHFVKANPKKYNICNNESANVLNKCEQKCLSTYVFTQWKNYWKNNIAYTTKYKYISSCSGMWIHFFSS